MKLESLDRRIHPAKVVLYRIKNWVFNLIWPYDVYGINRNDTVCLDCGCFWSSDCKTCNPPDARLDPKLIEELAKIKPPWDKERVIWITGENKDE